MGTNKNKIVFFHLVFWELNKYNISLKHCLPEYLALESLLGLAREWDQFKEIPPLTFPFTTYAKKRIQEQAIQWIVLKTLMMRL